jgi:hypothetical protein
MGLRSLYRSSEAGPSMPLGFNSNVVGEEGEQTAAEE